MRLRHCAETIQLEQVENGVKIICPFPESPNSRESNRYSGDLPELPLQNKQTEFEGYKAYNDRTEGLKVKAYEISVVKEKHDELVKQSLLTKSHYEGPFQRKTRNEVEDHPRISSISNQTKSVTACNDSLNSRTSNVNAVCATCEKCVFNSNHDAYVSKFLNDVNARTKKPNVVPISTRNPKSQANKFVATPHKKTVASESTTTNSKSYYRMLYKRTSKAWKWWIAQQ
ncbi:hypothetical protein Tco_0794236 [Tanacetum coccineum]